jgi:phenylpropionate dioxygenase-like ring-hydroxylating dioxygenase large terminal subunit
MNEPRKFNDRVKITAYPTLEMGGVIWAYMGPADKKPAPPAFELTQVPETHRYMTKVWQECNWLQAMEGGIDTSHAPILHRKLTDDTDEPGISPNSPFLQGAAPDLEVETTDYGFRYFGIRPIGEDKTFVRGYHYVMPFTQLRPSRYGKTVVDGHFWVPMDDYNVMVYNWGYSWGDDPLPEEDSALKDSGNNFQGDVDPANNFRSIRNRDNNYMLDRDIQKNQTFTGIRGINAQDRAIQESMGPIVDRTQEFLGPADIAIVAARKLLEQAIETVKDDGEPLGVAPTYYNIRAAQDTYGKDDNWKDALMDRMHP